jgi:hypothetical protein
MKIKVGDLVNVKMSKDNGIILRIIEQTRNNYSLLQQKTMMAEVYWQNIGRSRLELLSDLIKIN